MDERAGAIVYMASRLFRDSDTAQLLAALWSVIVEMNGRDAGGRPTQTGMRKSESELALTEPDNMPPSAMAQTPVILPKTAARLAPMTVGGTAMGTAFYTPVVPSDRDTGSPPAAPNFTWDAAGEADVSEPNPMHYSKPGTHNKERGTREFVRSTLAAARAAAETPLDEDNSEDVKARYYKLAEQIVLLSKKVPAMMDKYQHEIDRLGGELKQVNEAFELAAKSSARPNIPGKSMETDVLFYGFSGVEFHHFAVFLNELHKCANELVRESELNHVIHTAHKRNYELNKRKDTTDYDFATAGESDQKDEEKRFAVYRQSDDYRLERRKLLLDRFKAIDHATLVEKARSIREMIAASPFLSMESSKMVFILLMLNRFLDVVARVKPNPN